MQQRTNLRRPDLRSAFAHRDLPGSVVDVTVVPPAQQHAIADMRLTALLPGHDMVRLTRMSRDATAWNRALVTVSSRDRPPLVRAEHPLRRRERDEGSLSIKLSKLGAAVTGHSTDRLRGDRVVDARDAAGLGDRADAAASAGQSGLRRSSTDRSRTN